jgi:hypothetical protein
MGNMANPDQIQLFLHDFQVKLGIWGVIYRDDRTKNTQALLDLEITPAARENLLRSLDWTDYSEGPKKENLFGGSDMWVFGKSVKDQEVYIKITLGLAGQKVICISFHLAERPMKYPFKK